MALFSWASCRISWGIWCEMTEDAKFLDDGPDFEPTKRLRGLAAVEGFAEVTTMSENGEGVSTRGNLSVPVDWHHLIYWRH